ncbi:MAG: ion transporter [bacterium]|nr:ion transporter [bacterium]
MAKRIFEILEMAAADDAASRAFDIFIISVISLNAISVMLETMDALSTRYGGTFDLIETCSVIVFTVEYVLRLWSCTAEARFAKPVAGRIRYAMTPLAVIDFIAILPFYLPMLLQLDLRFIRILRLFRMFRLFKMGRYVESIRICGNVFKAKKEELVIGVCVVLVLLVFAASFIYAVEHDAQPEVFSSIPASMWWGVATLTTVGYGDVYPVTPLGKVVGAIIAILGIGLFAVPAGILASAFAEEMQRLKGRTTCPHCGKTIE